MALLKHEEFCPDVNVNNGVEYVKQIQLEGIAAAPTVDLANGRMYYSSASNILYARINGSWVNLGASGGGVPSITTWDDLYDADKSVDFDDGTMTFVITGNTAGLTINKTASGAGTVLAITNAGTGNDIGNTSASWYIKRSGATGILELGSGGTINATDGALSIGSTATATTLVGTCVVAKGLTVSAGGAAIVSISNIAASLSVTNNTITDYATGMVQITSTSLTGGAGLVVSGVAATTGSLLKIVGNTTFSGGGYYINCYDGSAIDFSVGVDGRIVIAGVASGNVLTITAGDMVMSDGSITITDADNANTVSITNNAALGAAIVQINSNATAITTNGRLFLSSHTGNAGSTAILNEFASAAADETVILQVTASAALAAGVALNVSGAAITTGTAVAAANLNALTSGIGLSIASSAVAITGAGRLVYVNHTGNAGDSAILSEFASAAADETTILKVTASAALAAGYGLVVSATAMTTGTALYISATGATIAGNGLYLNCYDVTTTASAFKVARYGATTIAGTASGTAALTLNAGDVVITSGYLVVSANAKGITFTGTGANGGVLKNLKNAATSALSGTQLDVEIDIGGIPYYFTVYPTKAP